MRELNREELVYVSGGSHMPSAGNDPSMLNSSEEGKLVTPFDGSNDMRYFCMTMGVGICIASGGGETHASARWGLEFRFASGEATSSEGASQMAKDKVEEGGVSSGFGLQYGGGQYQSGWGAGVGGQFGQTQSSG